MWIISIPSNFVPVESDDSYNVSVLHIGRFSSSEAKDRDEIHFDLYPVFKYLYRTDCQLLGDISRGSLSPAVPILRPPDPPPVNFSGWSSALMVKCFQ